MKTGQQCTPLYWTGLDYTTTPQDMVSQITTELNQYLSDTISIET